MNKKRIRLISIIVAAALAIGVGGVLYANNGTDPGGHKLLGVGEMGFWEEDYTAGYNEPLVGPSDDPYYVYEGETRHWDTQFIITNPNWDTYITIQWMTLIEEDENVVFEGTPDDWLSDLDIQIGDTLGELSPHEVWQISVAEIMREVDVWDGDTPLKWIEDDYILQKYTLEMVWTGVSYGGWWGWQDWQGGKPLIGWQKEKCQTIYWGYTMHCPPPDFSCCGQDEYGRPTCPDIQDINLAISEAEMAVFPGCNDFTPPVED